MVEMIPCLYVKGHPEVDIASLFCGLDHCAILCRVRRRGKDEIIHLSRNIHIGQIFDHSSIVEAIQIKCSKACQSGVCNVHMNNCIVVGGGKVFGFE